MLTITGSTTDGVEVAPSNSPSSSNKLLNSDGVCEKCATIPWDALFAQEESSSSGELEFAFEGISDEKAKCRTCQFFVDVLSILYYSSGHGESFIIRRCPGADLNFGFRSAFLRCYLKRSPNVPSPSFVVVTRSQSTVIEEHLEQLLSRCQFPKYPLTNTVVRPGQVLYPGDVNVALLKRWIDVCDGEHGHHCRPRAINGLANLRVIHCAQKCIVAAPPACRFAALSYVWGRSDKMDDSNSPDILPNILPRTVEDAITIVLALGYDYLWVDRYVSRVSL